MTHLLLAIGKAMAKYCVRLPTMKNLSEITVDTDIPALLDILSRCEEFADIVLVMMISFNQKETFK